MSEMITQPTETQELAIVDNKQNELKNVVRIPTGKNMDMYQLYISGYKLREIAELHDISIQAVTSHLNRVSAYYDKDWRTLQLNRVKAKANKVLNSFDVLVAQNDSKTVNNYMNKCVYDTNTAKGTAINLNVNNIVNGMSSNAGYDVDVEVVDSEVVDE